MSNVLICLFCNKKQKLTVNETSVCECGACMSIEDVGDVCLALPESAEILNVPEDKLEQKIEKIHLKKCGDVELDNMILHLVCIRKETNENS